MTSYNAVMTRIIARRFIHVITTFQNTSWLWLDVGTSWCGVPVDLSIRVDVGRVQSGYELTCYPSNNWRNFEVCVCVSTVILHHTLQLERSAVVYTHLYTACTDWPVDLWPNNEEQTSAEKYTERHTDGYSDQNACHIRRHTHNRSHGVVQICTNI